MTSHRRRAALLSVAGVAVVLASAGRSLAQNTGTDVPPVIDVHVHAMDESFPGLGPMCPNTSAFTASDPSTKEAPFGWARGECTPKQKRDILYFNAVRFLRLDTSSGPGREP